VARYTGSVCRLCRREGAKLYLKGDRCYKEKCAVEKKPFPPGQHGGNRRRKKVGPFGLQLREKQKVRRMYGVQERQFRNCFARADHAKGVTGEVLLQLLEQRLDNVVYRLGMTTSRAQARQLVFHGHIQVDGKRVDRPAFEVKPEQVISIREKSRKNPFVEEALQGAKGRGVPEWLTLETETFSGKVERLPLRTDIT